MNYLYYFIQFHSSLPLLIKLILIYQDVFLMQFYEIADGFKDQNNLSLLAGSYNNCQLLACGYC